MFRSLGIISGGPLYRFRNILKINAKILHECKNGYNLSTKGSYDCTLDESTGIATLTLKRKPVNSLNTEFLTDLTTLLNILEKNSSVKGLVITSGLKGIFSAGLDIKEMYKSDVTSLQTFWRLVQNFWMKLYMLPVTTMAAINGHSPAGGCLMALSCDYRIMASGPFTIGLNEALIGIVAPLWLMELFRSTIGHRQAEKALHIGTMFGPQEALQVSLVDEVVSGDELSQRTVKQLLRWIRVPSQARAMTKQMLRKPFVEKLVSYQEEDVDNFVNFVMQESVQNLLEQYLQLLKK
ncbi:hypothetical protein HELRODRAFT_155340 [Helobdella robusta]|uniref:Enoyl-CoA delta isomerase 1, mitochondrial n=1 Tax=Helobdella robusta TaxID=6412 RepID=T1ELI0_HELRO|nr:hypothetical protein HELRODRAFT_155340 [Helobdella robusta]ESN93147.1 hypothetical protein HELRODRAFT_155340 [Helobdella robusta]